MAVGQVDPAKFDVFLCERQRMTLSRPGCARLWESAQTDPPKPWEGRAHCATCPIGAANAGRAVAPIAEVVAELRRICPRCRRLAPRMIRASGSLALCVSCANRHYEAFRRRPDGGVGRNAKGNRPQLADVLHSEIIVAIEASGQRLLRAESVASLPEVMLRAARAAQGAISFSRAPANE